MSEMFVQEIARMQRNIDECDRAIAHLFFKLQDNERIDIMYEGRYYHMFEEVNDFIGYVLTKYPNIYQEFSESKRK